MSPEILSISNLTVHKGKLKKVNYKNWSLTFFFSVNCPYCKDLYPVFNSLSQQFPNIKFDYLNVNNERFNLLNRKLKYPLTFVPIIFLFNDENFVDSFKQTDESNIQKNFIQLRNFILRNTKMNPNEKIEKNNIPEYSIGIPGNHGFKKTCKIFNEAYASLN
jgi:thiol-disulfide isomerase/thioredoxin